MLNWRSLGGQQPPHTLRVYPQLLKHPSAQLVHIPRESMRRDGLTSNVIPMQTRKRQTSIVFESKRFGLENTVRFRWKEKTRYSKNSFFASHGIQKSKIWNNAHFRRAKEKFLSYRVLYLRGHSGDSMNAPSWNLETKDSHRRITIVCLSGSACLFSHRLVFVYANVKTLVDVLRENKIARERKKYEKKITPLLSESKGAKKNHVKQHTKKK